MLSLLDNVVVFAVLKRTLPVLLKASAARLGGIEMPVAVNHVDGSSDWFTRTPLAVLKFKIAQSRLVK